MNFIIITIGYVLIWIAINIGRKEDSIIPIIVDWRWWLQMVLVIAGTIIISKYF